MPKTRNKLRTTALLETLESRCLFATVNVIIDIGTECYQSAGALSNTATEMDTDMLNSVAAGTKGRGALNKALQKLAADTLAGQNTIMADLNYAPADGDPSLPAWKTSTVADVSAIRATFKADYAAINAIFAKHPDLNTSTVQTNDQGHFSVNVGSFKSTVKQLKADLA